MQHIGTNIKAEVQGRTLTITVDLGNDAGPSKSGKTRIIASSQGNVSLTGTDGAVLGLNIYRKA